MAKLGAIELLSRFLVKSYQQRPVVLPFSEIQKVCLLLLLFLQCSDSFAMRALEKVAHDLITTLLWIIVDSHHKRQAQNIPFNGHTERPNEWARSVVHRICRLKLDLSRIGKGALLVKLLQRILRECHQRSTYKQQAGKHVDQYLLSEEAMRLLDGLARHEENRRLLMDMSGLAHDVVQTATVCSKGQKDCCVTLDFLVIRLFRKLSWDTRNKFRLTKTPGFVKLLLTCSLHPCLAIRKEALGIFWMLSFDTASVQCLAGTTRDAALQALVKAAKVPELCGLALPSLHRMVRRKAPEHKSKILMLLSNDSITRTGGVGNHGIGQDGSHSNNIQTEIHAARLVESLCRSTSVNEPCHPNLMDALTTMAVSSSDAVRFWAAKAFHGQSVDKLNQFFLARTPAVLRSVVQLSKDPVGRVRERATSVLLQLTSQRTNAKLLGYNYELLEALLYNARHGAGSASSISSHHDKKAATPPVTAARLSIQGILSLASQEASRERIAKHHACVSTLASYGVSNDGDVELRKAALHGVIMLAHLL
ncbi:hypothetical protein ACA910_008087 [Epithemia clementina (nom. ined.)]